MKSGFAARIIIEPDFTCFLMLRKNLQKLSFFLLWIWIIFIRIQTRLFILFQIWLRGYIFYIGVQKNVLFCSKEENYLKEMCFIFSQIVKLKAFLVSLSVAVIILY